MATKYDLTGKKVGKLTVIRLLDIEERPTKTHGNYWLCKCECGNECKVPTAYLTGNSNYTQTSCGCDRRKKAFQITTNVKLENEYLENFNHTKEEFDKFLLIHKALIRTSGNDGTYYNNHKEEYKETIEYFWNDKQFNDLYEFWQKEDKDNTFYDWAKPSLDHIIPSSRGGANKLENFQFLTTFENLNKRDMTMEEWEEFKKRTHTTSDYFIENIVK